MDTVKKLFDDIERILKRDGKTVADLAKDLGRNYNQVYDWVVLRKFNPRAGPLMELQGWRNRWIANPAKAKA
jgi:transposase-like protein